ncbi:benzoate/H(+) symporter BenE family transporter [Roseococcus sp. DSY-14]|uniref:benzoate/H(+) symporter BenE family transporter n=1 Tax=Roseococcus sp. DSY-14 TaxID=3369650 RepID=UPI00387B73F8
MRPRGTELANGAIGFLFAASGPLAIILSAGAAGGLDAARLSSWVFGVFAVNGALTLAMSAWFRMPLCFFWTIPGTVLVAGALQRLPFEEVVGAYLATAALILAVGLSGLVGRAMRLVPMPIVMAMVAGVFLRFGLDLVHALHDDAALAAPMVLAFVLLSAAPALGRRLPPVIGALLVGAALVLLLGRAELPPGFSLAFARPVPVMPRFGWEAMGALVVPLAVTVLVVQNGQGFAVLRAQGHQPPADAVTTACGIGSLLAALVGAVSTCLAGPTNALVAQGTQRERHYLGAMVTGTLAVGFGLLAPAVTGLMLAAPRVFVVALAGLAMLRVLQATFVAAFAHRCALGALVCFLVTVADRPLLGIGAAFWGLLAGLLAARVLEPADLRAEAAPTPSPRSAP